MSEYEPLKHLDLYMSGRAHIRAKEPLCTYRFHQTIAEIYKDRHFDVDFDKNFTFITFDELHTVRITTKYKEYNDHEHIYELEYKHTPGDQVAIPEYVNLIYEDLMPTIDEVLDDLLEENETIH